MEDYLQKLARLFQESYKGKQQFLDLLICLDMNKSWEYHEISSWTDNIFNQFKLTYNWDFDSFGLQLGFFMQDALEIV